MPQVKNYFKDQRRPSSRLSIVKFCERGSIWADWRGGGQFNPAPSKPDFRLNKGKNKVIA